MIGEEVCASFAMVHRSATGKVTDFIVCIELHAAILV